MSDREELVLHVRHKEEIGGLIRRFPAFRELEGASVWEYDVYGDTLRQHIRFRWNYYERSVPLLQVMFIGKTGYGKSSLLNALVGKAVFPVDDVTSCTKQMDAAFFRMGPGAERYLVLSDMPGVGESEAADRSYLRWYQGMLPAAACVVYVLRADQRDLTVDEGVFDQLLSSEEARDKVVVALNFADKVQPVNRSGTISPAQRRTLEEKAAYIRERFDVLTVIPCCAKTGEGLRELTEEIADQIEMYTYFE